MENTYGLGGIFTVKCYDKDGNLKWIDLAKNAATDEGLNANLNIMFHASTQITTWYIGLITGTGTLAAGDTTMNVADASAFPNTGTLWVNGQGLSEYINYNGITGNATNGFILSNLVHGGLQDKQKYQ